MNTEKMIRYYNFFRLSVPQECKRDICETWYLWNRSCDTDTVILFWFLDKKRRTDLINLLNKVNEMEGFEMNLKKYLTFLRR